MNFKAVKRIKSYMKENKLKLSEFSKTLGISSSYLSRILNFKRGITDNFIEKLVDATSLDFEYWTGHQKELNFDEIDRYIRVHQSELEKIDTKDMPLAIKELLDVIASRQANKKIA
ncbi:helix-turn-helix transcriptional regulator [uncultured Clostridium sp.]|jgi:transcriptional regulator with XRE-family HTH domain|uniref:helix-turn-helix domain-containing protein n=1 Tax=uncultured Clostridium sp. TaxID=59620 RepID=UPI00260BFA6A|nr:helix-turn-helix transcriptional regulator [uncultured Clostridium sp.]